MDLNNIQKYLLKEIADITEVPQGAYNIRSDSQSIGRQSTENVEITPKEGVSGLDIFIKPDGYIFFTAVLDQPNLGYKRGVYYTIKGTDRQGRPIVANTRKMFSNVFSPTFEEYNNLKVLVGYNERTGRVIVVRKAIYE